MDGSSTGVCSNATFEKCSSQLHLHCSDNLVPQFHKSMKEEVWRVDAMLLVNAISAGVIVGIGAYGHRYRYHGFTRYLFLGATTLFLSIISVLLSASSSTHGDFNIAFGEFLEETLIAQCYTNGPYQYMVILCACLVPISAINTSAIVAGDDREARDIAPPFELLVQGIWTFYLVVINKALDGWLPNNFFHYFQYTPFAIIYAKMAYRYYAFERARRSFALGHNPRLIVGYMQQLRERSQHGEPLVAGEDVPPPLVVMGEEGRQVEKQPHGYLLSNTDGLVTLDRVWQSDNMLLVSVLQLKDICMSFALFKLLRCRFARYKPTDVISMDTLNFFRSVLLKDGEHERAFRMIADELSFLHDYYYSSLPISYSACWLPMLSISISLLSIGFCILAGRNGYHVRCTIIGTRG